MNRKICDILFFFICLFLIFNNIPKIIQMNFLGGFLGNKLSFYPIFIGLVYTSYCQYKYKNIFVNFDKFLKFILVYLIIILISLIIGLHNYPYYNLVLNGPVTQIEKLPKLIAFFDNIGINANEQIVTALWMFARTIKSCIFEVFYGFGGAYMIYCWYHDNWDIAFKILTKAVLLGLIFIFSYSVIEIFYLAENKIAEKIIIKITPYFHIIKADGTWHPPLLWPGKLRSIFSESSHYGIYFAFAMPILWYVFFMVKNNIFKIFAAINFTIFTFGLFLTQARTAVALFLGEILLLGIFLMILKKRKNFLTFIVVLLCSIFAFGVSNIFITRYIPPKAVVTAKITNNIIKEKNRTEKKGNNIIDKKKKENNQSLSAGKKIIKNKENDISKENLLNQKQINDYFEKNLFSLISLNKRSNGARYSVMIADFKIGLNNPLLGVGKELRNAYIPEYLPEISKNNAEVKMWLKNQQRKGILRSGFPKLGEYTSRFAETGLIGLTFFLIPPMILLYKLYHKIIQKDFTINNKLPFVFLTISLIGIMAAGIGDYINITYCYWILLGLGYAMCFGKRSNHNNLINNKENE